MQNFENAPFFVIGTRWPAYLELPLNRNPQRILVNYEAPSVIAEDGTTYDFEQFMETAARTDGNGAELVEMMDLPHQQFRELTRYQDSGEHFADLEALVSSLRSSVSPSDRATVGMYDIAKNSPPDHNHIPPTGDESFVRIGQDADDFFDVLNNYELGRDAWLECSMVGEFQNPNVRGIFKHFMSRYIGDYPSDYVLRTGGHADDLHNAFSAHLDFVSEDLPFEAQHIIPNYATTPVRHYRGHGVDVIVFGDMAGDYAYAWATSPELISTPRTGM